MDRQQWLARIDALHDTYCVNCPIKATLTKEKSKTAAHRFCITTCTVGEELKQCGRRALHV